MSEIFGAGSIDEASDSHLVDSFKRFVLTARCIWRSRRSFADWLGFVWVIREFRCGSLLEIVVTSLSLECSASSESEKAILRHEDESSGPSDEGMKEITS